MTAYQKRKQVGHCSVCFQVKTNKVGVLCMGCKVKARLKYYRRKGDLRMVRVLMQELNAIRISAT